MSLLVPPALAPANPTDDHCARTYTRATFHHVAHDAFDGRHRATGHERRTIRRVVACQRFVKSRPIVRFHLDRYRRHHLGELARRAAERHVREQIAALTPYNCGSAGRFAVPCGIVSCESGFSWSAYNSSGAAGPYQEMAMHGRPWPVRSLADQLEHHRIAARLWAGGAGASHWVCKG
jgi:hypothetical protein